MSSNQDNFRVGKTTPSRPGKLTIIGLIGVVIGFFVIMYSANKDYVDAQKKEQQPKAAPTQTQ
jgi:F0F1-type ATP synthase assembly protein I